MTGRFYIDNIDAYERFGVFIQKGGYNGVVQYPPLKKPDSIDWPDEDGIEVDLEEVFLDTKEFSINFCTVEHGDIDSFVEYLSKKPYVEFDFREIGCVKKLRLINGGTKKILKSIDAYTLQFADDFPPYDCEETELLQTGVIEQHYYLDNRSFADYGVVILKGSDEEIEKIPAVKKNVLVNLQNNSGAAYMGRKVVFQSKDVNLKCLLLAPDINTFWIHYNALLSDLSQPREKLFYTSMLDMEIPCYYNRSSVSKFDLLKNGKVWCEFTLTLTFTCFRLNDILYLLADYDNSFITTEDGENYIDIKIYE